jgi:hypothetical protein
MTKLVGEYDDPPDERIQRKEPDSRPHRLYIGALAAGLDETLPAEVRADPAIAGQR